MQATSSTQEEGPFAAVTQATLSQAGVYAACTALVAVTTIAVGIGNRFMALDHVTTCYLIPVIVSAIWWGSGPAIVSSVLGIAASAFFFYPPVYSLQVSNPQQLADLVLFSIVAITMGQLAERQRRLLAESQTRERQITALSIFSQRLAVATRAQGIYAAIEEHLSAITGHSVSLVQLPSAPSSLAGDGLGKLPSIVADGVLATQKAKSAREAAQVLTVTTGERWLVRALSETDKELGVLAIDLGHVTEDEQERQLRRIDHVLDGAAAVLERINLAEAIVEARSRAQAETLREALIGSVSHELRTPLSSIIGSASILAEAGPVASDERLSTLANLVLAEAKRLNTDIQNLLDASRISGGGVKPNTSWTDPTDIVNAVLHRHQQPGASSRLRVHAAGEPPLVLVDPILIEQALSQIVDNALKYSPPGSPVHLTLSPRPAMLEIAVRDQGIGVTAEERELVWQRFYRGGRYDAPTKGSGLGLWIARAFVTANGGTLELASEGAGLGTTIIMRLPASSNANSAQASDDDE